MTFDFCDERGVCRWSGTDRQKLLDYVAQRARRPPCRGPRRYSLHVRAIGQPTIVFELFMLNDGRIVVAEARTCQSLPHVSLDRVIQDVFTLVPPLMYPVGRSAGRRSVWDRLRDQWTCTDEPAPGTETAPDPSTSLLTDEELAELARWDPFASTTQPTRQERNET